MHESPVQRPPPPPPPAPACDAVTAIDSYPVAAEDDEEMPMPSGEAPQQLQAVPANGQRPAAIAV